MLFGVWESSLVLYVVASISLFSLSFFVHFKLFLKLHFDPYFSF